MSKVLTNTEFLQLVSEWQASDCQVEKNRIATIVLLGLERLIWKIVRRRAHWLPQQTQEDCFAEANIAVLRSALPKFDGAKAVNCKFSSYASNWITNGIVRHLQNKGSVVYIPCEGRKKAREALSRGEVLSLKDSAYLPAFIYWDRPVSGETLDGQTMQDFVCAKEGIISENLGFGNIDEVEMRTYARKLLDSIENTQHRKVVRLRIEGKTYREISKEIGLSRQRCEQIYIKSIENIRFTIKRWERQSKNAKFRQKPKIKAIEVVDRTTKDTRTYEERRAALCRQTISRRASARKQMGSSLD